MLTLISLMAANALPTHRAIGGYLARRAGLAIKDAIDHPWPEQLALLDAGGADLAFLCGLPYSRRSERLEPLGAPVPQGLRAGAILGAADVLRQQSAGESPLPRMRERGTGGEGQVGRSDRQPTYSSDLLVPAASRFQSFADLRGATWAYNEPGSFSGYAIVLAHLARLGLGLGYFGRSVESGAHLESLRLLAAGAADVAAIDSTVLDLALRDRPELAGRVRRVATLGPHPAPPLAAARSLPAPVRARLRAALLAMHEDAEGRAILDSGLIDRFAPVTDADYDAVRATAAMAGRLSVLQ